MEPPPGHAVLTVLTIIALAGCAEHASPPDTATLLASNEAARRAITAAGAETEREGRRIVEGLLARASLPPVITITDHLGNQYAFEGYEAEPDAFCGRQLGGRTRSTAATGGSMYRWYDIAPHQRERRCLPYWRVKRIEPDRLRGFLGAARG